MEYEELATYEQSFWCLQALKALYDGGYDISDYKDDIQFVYGTFFNTINFIMSYAAPKLFEEITVIVPYDDEQTLTKKMDILKSFNITDDTNERYLEAEYFLVVREPKLAYCYEQFDSVGVGYSYKLEYNCEKDAVLLRISEDDMYDINFVKVINDLISLSKALQSTGGIINEMGA